MMAILSKIVSNPFRPIPNNSNPLESSSYHVGENEGNSLSKYRLPAVSKPVF